MERANPNTVREEPVSENPTLVSLEHVRYLAERTGGEDDFLRDLKRAAREAGSPPTIRIIAWIVNNR